MALETRLAAITNDVFLKKRRGRNPKLVKASSGGNTIFLGALVTYTGETSGSNEVDLAALNEAIAGIIVGKAWAALDLSKDSDSPYTDGDYLWMEVLESGDECYVTAKTNTAITHGIAIECDGGFVIDTPADGATEHGSAKLIAKEAKTATVSTEKILLAQVI